MASKCYFDTSFTGYGKTGVRLLKIKRSGSYHEIKEIEVATELKLSTFKDYLLADNGDVVPTDTQKNTVYALAKQHQINTIEEFAMIICNHFLTTHKHVTTCTVHIEETPWKRIMQSGVEHAHAFVLSPEAKRFCDVVHIRGEQPKVSGGIKDMKILKTTQSGFTGFKKDKYTILPESTDRSFCTIAYCKYTFEKTRGVNFDNVWKIVKDIILSAFAGPPHTGVYSASVQNTMYLAENGILGKVLQIGSVEMVMPNVHYFTVNMAPLGLSNKDEVLMPVDKPSGIIQLALSRKPTAKL